MQQRWLALAVVPTAGIIGLMLPRFPSEHALLVTICAAGIAALTLLLTSSRTTSLLDLTTLTLMGFGALLPLSEIKVTTALYWSDVFLVLCVPFSILAALRHGTLAQLRPYQPVLLGGMAMVVGGILGSYRSENPILSMERLGRLALVALAMPIVIGLVADSVRKYQLLALSFIAGSTLSAAVAWSQTPTNVWTERRNGLAWHVNALGEMSALALAFALPLVFEVSGKRRLTAAVCCLVLLSGVLYSGSRGALLGVWVIALVVAVLQRRRWFILSTALAPLAMILVALYHDFGNSQNALARISHQLNAVQGSGAIKSDQGRAEGLSMTIDQIKESPIIGSGFDAALAGHSVPPQIWMATGLLGFAGYVYIVWRCGCRPFLNLVAMPDQARSMNWLLVGSLAAFLGSLAMHLISNPLWDRAGWLLPIMVLGSWALVDPLASNSSRLHTMHRSSSEFEYETDLNSPHTFPSAGLQTLSTATRSVRTRHRWRQPDQSPIRPMGVRE